MDEEETTLNTKELTSILIHHRVTESMLFNSMSVSKMNLWYSENM